MNALDASKIAGRAAHNLFWPWCFGRSMPYSTNLRVQERV